jgi:endonuclease/exonuclease/phosphatase family metal-dependent hydrolase
VTTELSLADFTVMTINWHFGGIDRRSGDLSAWQHSVNVINQVRPMIVLAQEMDCQGNPARLHQHLEATATALGGMTPILGPPAGGTGGNHTAIFVRACAGLQVINRWPTPAPGRPPEPTWCSAQVTIPGIAPAAHLYSVHLSPRSALDQLRATQIITSYITEGEQFALVGGDWNGYPHRPAISPEVLAGLPRHLQMTRCRPGPSGLIPNHDVADELQRAQLFDIAAYLDETGRGPADLRPTTEDGARVDRCHGDKRWAAAAREAKNLKVGSDHHAVAITFDLTGMAA